MTNGSTPEYRVTIPAKEDVEPETASLLEFVDRPPRGPIPTVAVLAHTPPLFGPFLGWASALALEGALPKRDHELIALRAIHHCHSEFERVEHSEFARDLGMTEVELARLDVDDGAEAPEWAEHEAALLRATDELRDELFDQRRHMGRACSSLLARPAGGDPLRRRAVHHALNGRQRARDRCLVANEHRARTWPGLRSLHHERCRSAIARHANPVCEMRRYTLPELVLR